jgi:CTP:molybdopterin cytidylyltransferase MocA
MTLRDFLSMHGEEIVYVEVDSPGVLKDMDTPEDYQRLLRGEDPPITG